MNPRIAPPLRRITTTGRAALILVALLLLFALPLQSQDEIYPDAVVAVIPPAMASPFHVALAAGADAVGEKFGWNVIIRAPVRETDFEGQVAIIQQVVHQGIDAVSVNPINFAAVSVAVTSANEAGVPMFMHNTITPFTGGEIAGYIGYDQWGGAAKLAEYVCDLLAARSGVEPADAVGEVYILTGIPGFHTNRRTGGFVFGLAKTCPGVKVVGSQTAEWEREKGLQVAAAALQQYPDIDVFFGNSDEMAIGACLAAAQLGMDINNDIFCVGIDGNAVTLDLIRTGEMTATLGVYPERMGETILEQINKYLLGQKIPEILLTPSIVVDINNLDAYIDGDTWEEPVPGLPETDNGLPTIPEPEES